MSMSYIADLRNANPESDWKSKGRSITKQTGPTSLVGRNQARSQRAEWRTAVQSTEGRVSMLAGAAVCLWDGTSQMCAARPWTSWCG